MAKAIKPPKKTLGMFKRVAAYKIMAQKREDQAAQAKEEFEAYLQR